MTAVQLLALRRAVLLCLAEAANYGKSSPRLRSAVLFRDSCVSDGCTTPILSPSSARLRAEGATRVSRAAPSGNVGGEAFEVRTSGARQVAAFLPASSRVARGEGACGLFLSKIPILPYEAERRISPSRTCDGVPFVKRRAAVPSTRGHRERHSSNRDNIGTRPGSSRADDSGFRCVNAEVNASRSQRWAPQSWTAAKFESWEQGLTGNENY